MPKSIKKRKRLKKLSRKTTYKLKGGANIFSNNNGSNFTENESPEPKVSKIYRMVTGTPRPKIKKWQKREYLNRIQAEKQLKNYENQQRSNQIAQMQLRNSENQQKLLTYLSLRNQPIFSSDNEYINRNLNPRHINKRFTKKRKNLRVPSQSINTTRRFK